MKSVKKLDFTVLGSRMKFAFSLDHPFSAQTLRKQRIHQQKFDSHTQPLIQQKFSEQKEELQFDQSEELQQDQEEELQNYSIDDSHIAQTQDFIMIRKYFQENITLDQVIEIYKNLKEQINELNIFLVIRSLERNLCHARSISQISSISIFNKYSEELTQFFEQIISFLPKLQDYSLLQVLKLIKITHFIDPTLKIINAKELALQTKSFVDSILKESVDSDTNIVSNIILSEIFYIYEIINWNLFHVRVLLEKNIRQQLSLGKTLSGRNNFNGYSLDLIIKTCEKAAMKDTYKSQKYADLSYYATQVYFTVNQRDTRQEKIVQLFYSISKQKLHIRSRINRIPELLMMLNEKLITTFDTQDYLLSVNQIIKVIDSYQYLPPSFDKTLLNKSIQFLGDYFNEMKQQIPMKTIVKIIYSLQGLKENNEEIQNLRKTAIKHIFYQFRSQVQIEEKLILKILTILREYKDLWINKENQLILEAYFQNSSFFQDQSQIGVSLIQLGLLEDGSKQIEEGLQNNEISFWEMIRIVNEQRKIDQSLNEVITQKWEEIKNLQEPNILYFLTNKVLKNFTSNDVKTFIFFKQKTLVFDWACQRIQQIWTQIDENKKLILIVNFYNSTDLQQELFAFFEEYRQVFQYTNIYSQQIDVVQLRNLTKLLLGTQLKSSLPVNYVFSVLNILLEKQIQTYQTVNDQNTNVESSNTDNSNIQQIFNILFSFCNLEKNYFFNLRGTLILSVRNSFNLFDKLINQFNQQRINLSFSIKDIEVVQRALMNINSGQESILYNFIYYYLNICLPQDYKTDRVLRFQYLTLGEIMFELHNNNCKYSDKSSSVSLTDIKIQFNNFADKLVQSILPEIEIIRQQSISWQIKFLKTFLFYLQNQKLQTANNLAMTKSLNYVSDELSQKVLSTQAPQSNQYLDGIITLFYKDLLQLPNTYNVFHSDQIIAQLKESLLQNDAQHICKYLYQIRQFIKKNNIDLRNQKANNFLKQLIFHFSNIPSDRKNFHLLLEYLKLMNAIKIRNLKITEMIVKDLKQFVFYGKISQIVECVQLLSLHRYYNEEIIEKLIQQFEKELDHCPEIERIDFIVSLAKLGWNDVKIYRVVFEGLINNNFESFRNLEQTRKEIFLNVNLQTFWTFLIFNKQSGQKQEYNKFLQYLIENFKKILLNEKLILSNLQSQQVMDIFNVMDFSYGIESLNDQNKLLFKDCVDVIQQNSLMKKNLDICRNKKFLNKPITDFINCLKIQYELNKMFKGKRVDLFISSLKKIVVFENTFYLNLNQNKKSGFSLTNQMILDGIKNQFNSEVQQIIYINEWEWNQLDDKQKNQKLLGLGIQQ